MKVRIEAIEWAIRRLPAPTASAPPYVVIPVSEFRESATSIPKFDDNPRATVSMQRLVFKREQYAEGQERWYEWTLDVSESA